ncbi:MAG: type I 3-dehydroquinate dehydratase [Bacteroidales bacterium]|nr:type I 3-dehydroquinate dehydratase [Bacteroidales bacterium]
MICTCIQNRSLQEILQIVDRVEMAEIRLDRCPLSLEEIQTLFSFTDTPLIATCRVVDTAKAIADRSSALARALSAEEGRSPAQIAEERLLKAITAGAKYIDIETEAPASMSKRLHRAAQETGTMVIRSWHDFNSTGDVPSLMDEADKCQRFGADIIKIVTTANSPKDVDTLFTLYDYALPGSLVAFCMGEYGKSSRLECIRRGAPWTYAALTPEDAAAPGQWTAEEMAAALYRSKPGLNPTLRLSRQGGPVHIPASKSFAQRAIIAAALSEGTSHLGGYAPCGDNESAIQVAQAIGATVDRSGDTLIIKGIGARPGCLDTDSLHVGESGLLARLMIPVCSVICKGNVRITGEKTLPSRPLKGAGDIMASFGVLLSPDGEASVQSAGQITIPLTVKGNLVPGRAEISGKDGSQLISGLLTALPLASDNSQLLVTKPKSIPYLFITLDVLRKFGIKTGSEMEGDDEFLETQDWNYCTGITFRIKGGQSFHAADFNIEGDWSTAAGFLVAGAVFGKAEISGLDLKSLQADLSIMDILSDAGASLSYSEDEGDEASSIICQKAPLRAFETDLNNAPDLFPVVAVLAAFSQGTSRIAGMGRLAGKESDRGAAILEMLDRMGVTASREGDEMIIEGLSLSQRLLEGKLLRGGKYTSSHDHRMVMALTVAAQGADSDIEIDDTACVAKSCPQFFELFNQII